MVDLFLTGLSHRNATLALRERLAIRTHELPTALSQLLAAPIQEAVILSTCNRVELYAATRFAISLQSHLVEFLSRWSNLRPADFTAHLYQYSSREAVAQLFRVAAGLDSMILGETEIAAQVKQAYLTAHAHGATGPVLNRLFQKALHCAKVVRSATRIAEGSASIGSVVVTLARQRFGDLATRQALLWGAGKAAEATARHLIKAGVGQLWIVNRTQPKAQDLAKLCRSGWLSWQQAQAHLAHVDIAVVCTQAPHYVIDREDIERCRSARSGRPLVLVDLAVPRNVDPAVAHAPGVRLYNIDDLQRIAQEALAQRHHEVARCEALIQEQVEHFWRWCEPVSQQEMSPCGCIEALVSV